MAFFFPHLGFCISLSWECKQCKKPLKNRINPYLLHWFKQIMSLLFPRLSFWELEYSKFSLQRIAMPTAASSLQRRCLLQWNRVLYSSSLEVLAVGEERTLNREVWCIPVFLVILQIAALSTPKCLYPLPPHFSTQLLSSGCIWSGEIKYVEWVRDFVGKGHLQLLISAQISSFLIMED